MARAVRKREESDVTSAESHKQAKKAAKAERKGEHGRITPGNAKKVLGVARVVSPVVAPYAMKAAASARQSYDRMRARRLGVAPEELGRFTGRGAALHARIAGDATALGDLRSRAAGATDRDGVSAEQFADTAEKRLTELTSAVRAAERMPVSRRRAAHRAVSGELDRIEADLLHRLGV